MKMSEVDTMLERMGIDIVDKHNNERKTPSSLFCELCFKYRRLDEESKKTICKLISGQKYQTLNNIERRIRWKED